MNDKNISQKVLEAIKNQKIVPKPKWTFLLKENLMWAFGIASLIVGGLAFAVIIHMVRNNDWDVYQDISGGLLQFILLTLPYFWIVFLALFIFIAHSIFQIQFLILLPAHALHPIFHPL